jgi:hypothetical protein
MPAAHEEEEQKNEFADLTPAEKLACAIEAMGATRWRGQPVSWDLLPLQSRRGAAETLRRKRMHVDPLTGLTAGQVDRLYDRIGGALEKALPGLVEAYVREMLPRLADQVVADATAGVEKAVKDAIAAMPRPQDGRDALEIDVLASIEPRRSYGTGTFASYRGGLLKAVRNTDPLEEHANPVDAGWRVIVDGLAEIDCDWIDERTMDLVAKSTSGKRVMTTRAAIPGLVYKGVWGRSASYVKGDSVTADGNLWIARRPSEGYEPGKNDCWQLAVRKGRDLRPGKG